MIITISGTPGSGKGTVGKLLAKRLHYRYFSIGAIRRAMAIERGMTLQEFNVLGEKQPFTDDDVDQWQKKLGRTHDNLIVEGRTSFHFIPQSVKVFLTADLEEAARRIFHDRAHVRLFEASKKYTTPHELAHGLRHRIASDDRRYRKYYGLNIYNHRHYDLVVDTTRLTPAETLEKILKHLTNGAKVSLKKAVVSKLGRKTKVVPKAVRQKTKIRN